MHEPDFHSATMNTSEKLVTFPILIQLHVYMHMIASVTKDLAIHREWLAETIA
jgi:hypothetical protein